MNAEVICGLITAVSVIAVAIIEAIAGKDRKVNKAYRDAVERRSVRRAQESKLSMAMMYATLQLSIVSSNALTNGHNNGNVEVARKAAEKAQADYEEFLRAVASEELV